MAERPAHIITHGGADRTMCGIRLKLPAALPFLAAAHVPAHAARGTELCDDCRVCYEWLLKKVGE